MIDAFAGAVPVLGVCLGHQCIVQQQGGKIVRAERLMHGKTSQIQHDGKTVFEGISQPFEVGRYHSLCAEVESLPKTLEVSAETESGVIMGVRHKSMPIEGVQFHPESVLTPEGDKVMTNFMRIEKN
jgi:anthranilate synthase/aminodeoxychorismate synthase-like glutamine amidotransferase